MKILFFGTPSFVIPILQSLIEHFDVVGVVTTPDELVGRKQILTSPPVKVFADRHSMPVFQPEKLVNYFEQFEALSPDFLVVASYGKLIPQVLLDIPKIAALNIHPSPLPTYRGPSPIQSAILAGETETEVDIIQMDAELDHGPILARQKLSIASDDTFESLVAKAFQIGAKMLPSTIEQWCNRTIVPEIQDHSKATFTKHFNRQDGYIDADNPPSKEQIDRTIRAFYPWPNAWTRIEGKIVKLLPGRMVQMEGKNVVTKKDFLNGYPQYRESIEKLM